MQQVGIGLIGCGGFARWHLRNLQGVPNAHVAALCDPNPEQLAETVRQFPNLRDVPQVLDYHDLLKLDAVDGVEISTPHYLHAQQTLDAFAAGKHVMCEKPMVGSVAEAHQVIEARNKSGKVGLIGYQRHQIPEYQFIRSKIASGEFGPVTYVSALQTQEWKRLTQGTWRQNLAQSCGGQLNDSGSHFVDILLWTTQLTPAYVSAVCDSCGTEVDINSAVQVKFTNGAIGSINIVGDAPRWLEEISIWCEQGGFLVRNAKLTIQYADGSQHHVENLPTSSQNPDDHFVRCILGHESPLAPFECGLQVALLTQAAFESSEKGSVPIQVIAS